MHDQETWIGHIHRADLISGETVGGGITILQRGAVEHVQSDELRAWGGAARLPPKSSRCTQRHSRVPRGRRLPIVGQPYIEVGRLDAGWESYYKSGFLGQINQHDIRIFPQAVKHDLLAVRSDVEGP